VTARGRMLVAASVVLSWPAGCSSSDMAHPSATPAWEVSGDPLTVIGLVDGPEEYLFSGIAAAGLLEDGRIAVADRGSSTIRIYDPDGSHLVTMGGEGQGPGEFIYLSSIALRGADTIVAYDARGYRLTRFDTTGAVLSTVTLRADDGWPEIYLGELSDGDHLAAWIVQGPRSYDEVTPDVMRIARFGAGGDLRSPLLTTVGMRRLGSPLPFSPHFLAVLLGDTVFHTDGLGVIRAMGADGTPVRELAAPFPGWDPREARQRFLSVADSAQSAALGEATEAATDSVPTVSAMLSDPAGLLWLKRYDPSTDSHWLGRARTGGDWAVVRSDGPTVATVALPIGFRAMGVRGDRVVGVVRDELGVERVHVYGVVRTP
jgi:hypothetical protein